MLRQRLMCAALAFCVCVSGSVAAVAADVSRVIPDNALGFAVVNRVGDTQGKIAKLADSLQLPEKIKAATTRMNVAALKGVDKDGSFAVAAIVDSETPGAPVAVWFVPTTDYQAAIGQLQPEDAEAKIAKVTMGNNPCVVGKKGAYAVLTAAGDASVLEQVLDSTDSVAASTKRLRRWAARKDAYAVATPGGIKMAQQAILAGLAMGKAKIAEQGGEQAEMTLRGIELYEELFKAVDGEVAYCAIGVQINEDGDVHILGRSLLAPDGTLAKLSKTAGEAPADSLAGLPQGPFVFAGGGPYPASWAKELTGFYVNMMKMYMGMGAIPEDQAKKFAELTEESMKGLRSMGLMMGTVEPGESLYSNMIATIDTDDAQKYMATYGRVVGEMGEIFKKADNPLMTFEAEDIEIDGIKALKMSMDMSFMFGEQEMPPEAKKMIETMIGAGGKLDMYAAAADDNTVIITYVSKERLIQTLKAVREGRPQFSEEPNVAKTAGMLLPGAQWTGFWSPEGTLKLAAAVVATVAPDAPIDIPEFPSPAPIGFAVKMSPGVVDTDMVIPADILNAIPEFVKAIKAMDKN